MKQNKYPEINRSIFKERLIQIAKKYIDSNDPSHDFSHSYRVFLNAIHLAKIEGGDLEIIAPAALFHDLIVYPKNHPNSNNSQRESALATEKILSELENYPKNKIENVVKVIEECSFSQNIFPSSFESKIVQDADKLEATGVISIMRTFCSTGQMKRPLFHEDDPFCTQREPDSKEYALDLFYTRLLKAKDRMHTQTAKLLAIKQTKILEEFLNKLKEELEYKKDL